MLRVGFVVLRVKRVYEDPVEGDGFRVLVDRLWPRGLSREKAEIGLWLKTVAPSNELRKWFGHDPDRWTQFKARYFKELEGKSGDIEQIIKKTGEGVVTLVYAAKNTENNNAVALKEYIENHTN